jgi:hypothetical protein
VHAALIQAFLSSRIPFILARNILDRSAQMLMRSQMSGNGYQSVQGAVSGLVLGQ